MRIIFAGTPRNAARTLELALEAGVNVVGVLTRTDSPKGRSGELSASPVAEAAARHGLDVFKANSIFDSALKWIESKKPDLGVIVAYGSILKADALEIPARGWINVHYSLLPEYPGASPVQHALLDGKQSTGVTVFQLDDGVDTGPILMSRSMDIPSIATAGTLLDELTELGGQLLIETLADFDQLFISRRVQTSGSAQMVTRKINRAMARVDFSLPRQRIANLVRAMNPEPIAWFDLDSLPIRVLEASTTVSASMAVGHARLVDGELLVGCADGALALKVVQPAGKRPMTGADWFRGLRQELLLLS